MFHQGFHHETDEKFRCLEPLMKHEARDFDMSSKSIECFHSRDQ